ncbi:MAG: hypothetical protein R3324_07505, partial [Halobacteriales archaeon]|nr:hypothetical protein [Halobacteriales archaeon]
MASPPTPLDAFATALQRCSPATFAAFVIELYEAQGWEADPVENRVRLRRRTPPGDSRLIGIDHPANSDRTDPAAVDAVVTPARGPPPAI